MALTKVTGSVIKDSVSLSGNVSVGGTLTYQDVTNVDALGIGTFRAGIDITGGNLIIPDKIIHSGDTNTSLRFPSADTITAETGGTERFRISSNGLVNIGAGSSASGLSPLLHLHKNASNSSAYFHITNNDTGITNNDGFLLGVNPSGDCLVFNKDSTPMRFATAGIERLRIDAGGGLQLGTTTVTASKLTVYGANDAAAIFQGSGTGTGAGNGLLVGNNGGTTGLLWNYENGNTLFATNNIERLRIDSGGRLIIGHTAALDEFHGPYGTTNRNPRIQINGTNVTQASMSITSWDNNVVGYYGPALFLAKSGSSTIGTNARVSNNNSILGSIIFSGDDGTDFVKGAMIQAAVDTSTGDNDMPGRLMFLTTADGAQEPTERLRINSSGQLIMTNAATQTFFDFSTTNNNTRGLFTVSGKDNSGNAVTVRIGGFGDTSRGEIFTHSNHNLGFATNNAAAQVILHTSGLFDVVGECRATNFYLRGNGSAPTADASIFRPADNSLAFATASTERIRIENSGISGTIKNNYALVAFVTDRDDGSRTTGSTSYQDDTGLNLTNAINYRHGDIFFVRALAPTGIALVSTDTTNYQGVYVRIKITPSSGTTRYSADTKGWYRNDGRATKETMQLVTCYYHLTDSNTSQFNDNVDLSFQVQYHRDSGGAGSYGATGLSIWGGERTLEVWQFRKAL
tara:strand:+ start:178 stop:2235 length:2058 start_codon:yes stop_codon:yes gene_type:complete